MTNEQKNQVAAMNASGMSIDEIVLDTKLGRKEVEDFVAERNAKKKGRGHPISAQTKQAIVEWYQSGHPVSQTAKKFGVDPKTVKSAIAAIKEKEPIPAATETSSQKIRLDPMYISNDTTVSAESQALESARKKLLAIYETLTPEETRAWELGEVYAEVVRGLGE